MQIPFSEISVIQDLVNPVQSALLTIDMQNDFCHDNGVSAQGGRDVKPVQAMAPNLVKFLLYCRIHHSDLRIFHVVNAHTEQTDSYAKNHRIHAHAGSLSGTARAGTWGAQIYEAYPELKPQGSEVIITKHRYSAFIGTDLDLILRSRRITTLILTGVNTQCCVESTARQGYMLDYHIILPADLTATSTPDLYDSSLFNIATLCGYVVTSDVLKKALDQTGK